LRNYNNTFQQLIKLLSKRLCQQDSDDDDDNENNNDYH